MSLASTAPYNFERSSRQEEVRHNRKSVLSTHPGYCGNREQMAQPVYESSGPWVTSFIAHK
jgi:hypothetical protein